MSSSFPPFDRSRLHFRPLAERKSKSRIDEIAVDPDGEAPDPGSAAGMVEQVARRILGARKRGAPVVLCHGAHLVRNGLSPLVIRLIKEGWITHVATNGAGSIHDWEYAFLGRSTEDVRENVAAGEFGIWEETGSYLSLALHVGAVDGLGYGASVGRMVSAEAITIPTAEELRERIAMALRGAVPSDVAGAAFDLMGALEVRSWPPGKLLIPHPWKTKSLQAACYSLNVPFTVHPGIGYDIVYSHPLFRGGAVGRSAMTDFLTFAASIERLEGGVYLSVGSSVMSPMIFEKSLSMARNVLRQKRRKLVDFDIVVCDLMAATWDWSRGEPPPTNPAYYVRFCKSFSRMGGRFLYVGMDNRVFLQNIYARLRRT